MNTATREREHNAMLQKLLEDHTTDLPAVLVADAPPAQRDQVVSSRTWSELGDSQGVPIQADAPMIPVDQAAVLSCISTGAASLTHDNPIRWRRQWLTCLAETAVPGANVDSESLSKLGKNFRGVFVIDTSPLPLPASTTASDANGLRVLFTDVLRWFRDQQGRPFGTIVFTTKDLVKASVPQNSDQLLNRYRAYEQ